MIYPRSSKRDKPVNLLQSALSFPPIHEEPSNCVQATSDANDYSQVSTYNPQQSIEWNHVLRNECNGTSPIYTLEIEI
jgi:hypothetical protein